MILNTTIEDLKKGKIKLITKQYKTSLGNKTKISTMHYALNNKGDATRISKYTANEYLKYI